MCKKLQTYWESRLRDYANILSLMVCKRCFLHLLPPGGFWHHRGALIIELSKNNGLKTQDIHNWCVEDDHGLLHGFLVGFFAFQNLLKRISIEEIIKETCGGTQTDNYPERLMASCLLHDYAKVIWGHENHDSKLKKYFPDLLEETYTHSKPQKISDMIVGDRTELKRYKNYKNWSIVDIDDTEETNYFYCKIRPVLARLFKYRYDVWIRHGVEGKQDGPKLEFPLETFPQHYWWKYRDPPLPYICVETGQLLIDENCLLTHGETLFQPMGFISNSMLREFGFKTLPCSLLNKNGDYEGRDHLLLPGDCSLPIDKWIFLYDYHHMEEKYNESDIENILKYTMGIDRKLAFDILYVTNRVVEYLNLLR